jgi:hypothetical protein
VGRRTTVSFLFDLYFNSDILARFTDNDGASFSATQVVSSAPSFQYQPAICVDTVSGKVVVAYYSAQNDVVGNHRNDIYVATSATGAAPYIPLRVTSASNVTEMDPFGRDFFLGDYLEAACGPNFAYVHYTANYRAKSGAPFDSPAAIIKPQDNFLAKVTLPRTRSGNVCGILGLLVTSVQSSFGIFFSKPVAFNRPRSRTAMASYPRSRSTSVDERFSQPDRET